MNAPPRPAVEVRPAAAAACRAVADQIVALLREKPGAVLGLATGLTQRGVYEELARRHREERLSFAAATTFNLDEYWPVDPDAAVSFHRFMRENLFRHVDLQPARTHLPDGTLARERLAAHCRDYEEAVSAAGGIDLQLLGIGSNGHIGFNEPGAARDSRTRLVELHPATLEQARRRGQAVPEHGITMGVGTILAARRVVLLALGADKAEAVRRALEEPETSDLPASFLQSHPSALFVLDPAAAAALAGAPPRD